MASSFSWSARGQGLVQRRQISVDNVPHRVVSLATSPPVDDELGGPRPHCRRGGILFEPERRSSLTDHSVILGAAAYASEPAARRDFQALTRANDDVPTRHVAAAILHKGFDGTLTIDLDDVVEPGVPWGGAPLGAALTVLAAPLGLALLPPVVTAPTGWRPVTALVSQFWEQVAQETLHRMSELLESNPAGIVVAAIGVTADDVRAFLLGATTTIIADSTALDAGSPNLQPDDGLDR